MIYQRPRPVIPACTWNRPIGLGWDKPYTVRYASNLDDGPWHGMPLGGFGAGCIGRSPRGDFNLWHLDGGEHFFRSLPACQFSVFEYPEGGEAQAYALATEAPADGSLGRWSWYPPSTAEHSTGSYRALYPRSWYSYHNVFQTEISFEQFSPIWAGNYQESSYPLAVFHAYAYNPTDVPVTVSIMLTWQNIVGWFTNTIENPQVRVRDDGSPVYDYQPRWGESTGNYNQLIVDFYRVGCLLDRVRLGEAGADDRVPVREGEGQWAIATITNPALEVFHHCRWNPAGDGGDIWDSFAGNGSLPDCQNETAADPGEQIGAAIAIRFTLKPGKSRKIPFIVSWDFPVLKFGADVEYYRRYTDFFGFSGNNAWSMVRTALKHDEMWQEEIQNWQEPILSREDLPNWFKMALFNELYDLTSGGTIWSSASETDPIGQFAVLECLDYRWYESLDVRLYGAFGLVLLWPKLEKAILEAYVRAIPASDDTPRIIGYNQAAAIRKAANATPHDLGAPNEHPWEKTNYTSYQDCNLWKDLASDFVLQIYRYFIFSEGKDIQFITDAWPAIVKALGYLKEFDRDGDGIPENSGAPDQTFDDWKLQGVSAYCGGLWLAALEAAIAIGEIIQEQVQSTPELADTIATYRGWLAQSQPVYQQLWNGKYYQLDSQSGSDVVMADQLCGQFCAQLLNLPDIVPSDRAQLALQTIFDSCFVKFNQHLAQNGEFPHPIGAANGVKPDGSPENPQATHPLEIWTGINFGLAAFLVQMGMTAEAMQIAEAVVRQIYEGGLQFRTPEAITAAKTFRASHYLRAMAIWGIYHVLPKPPEEI